MTIYLYYNVLYSRDIWSPSDIPSTFGEFSPIYTDIGDGRNLQQQLESIELDGNNSGKHRQRAEQEYDGNAGDDEAEYSARDDNNETSPTKRKHQKKRQAHDGREPAHPDTPNIQQQSSRSTKRHVGFVSNSNSNVAVETEDSNDADVEEEHVSNYNSEKHRNMKHTNGKHSHKSTANSSNNSGRAGEINLGKVGGKHKGHQQLKIDPQLLSRKEQQAAGTHNKNQTTSYNPFAVLRQPEDDMEENDD